MTDQTIRSLYQAGLRPAPLTESDQAALAAALIGGSAAEREAGLERLASHPQGPALARVIAAIAPESARLSADLRAAQRPARLRPALLALAASAAALAVLVSGVWRSPVELPAADSDRILVGSFENGGSDPARIETTPRPIFRGSFDS